MRLRKLIKDVPCRIVGKFLAEEKQYRLVRKCLARHAENYGHLETDEDKRMEDDNVYSLICFVDENNKSLIERHFKFYNLYKKRLIRESS